MTAGGVAAVQAKASSQVKDLLTRLNNAVKQRNTAREEALLAVQVPPLPLRGRFLIACPAVWQRTTCKHRKSYQESGMEA